MKANASKNPWAWFIAAPLMVLAALLVVAVVGGISVPFIAGERAAIVALTVIGFFSSMFAMQAKKMTEFHWTSAVSSILGFIYLALFVLVLAGFSLPLIATERGAFIVLAALLFVKVLLSRLHGFDTSRRLAHGV